MEATITFGNYTFNNGGVPQWSIGNNYESEGGNLPKSVNTRVTVSHLFNESSHASNMQRWSDLMTALQIGEGVLSIKDEHGTELFSQTMRVVSDDLPTEWRQYLANVSVVFEGRKQLSTSSATFTPTGGVMVALPNIESWAESLRTTRFSTDVNNRRETLVSILAKGRASVDKTLPLSNRISVLRAMAESMKGVDAKDGTLVFGGVSTKVYVESLETNLGDASDQLEWTLSASYKRFPDGDYAEADFEVLEKDDIANGEQTISVQGNIRAKDKSSADIKQEQIKSQYLVPGTSFLNESTTDSELSGTDGESTWVNRKFALEFRRTLPDVTSYELRVSTREDVRSADTTIVYEGRVTGTGVSAALSVARSLGLDKHPVMQSSSETVSTRKTGATDEVFIEVTFSYQYVAKNAWRYAEVNYSQSVDPFGESKEIINGFTVADTLQNARAFAHTFKLSGRLPREYQETHSDRATINPVGNQQPTQLVKFDFSYSYYLTPSKVSCGYSREESKDLSTLELTTTFNGSVRGPTESVCMQQVDHVVGTGNYGKLMQQVRSVQYEKQALGETGQCRCWRANVGS